MNRKPSKYRNVKTKGFHSKKEAKRAEELKLMERAGLITELSFQVPFKLGKSPVSKRTLKYVADFVYVELISGLRVVEDVKGFITAEARTKLAWFNEKYGEEFQLRII